MMLPPMSSGMSTRLTMNDLVRTTALYSRAAMVSILRTATLLRFGGGNADKNVLQRRPGQLEMAHPAALQERRQHGLRIDVAGEAKFLQPAEIRYLDHAG